jgi:plasmid stability protein
LSAKRAKNPLRQSTDSFAKIWPALEGSGWFRVEVYLDICYHDSIQILEEEMAQLLVRNLEDQLKTRLQRRAKRHGHSMEAEARDILRNALREREKPRGGLGTEIANMFRGIGLREGEEIAEIHDFKMEIPDFES